jgi:tetratricopeptide (TPR) repeat protein
VVEIVEEGDAEGAAEAVDAKEDLGIDLDFDMPVPCGQVKNAASESAPPKTPVSQGIEDDAFAEFEEFRDTLTDDDASHAVNLDQLRSRFASGEDSGSSDRDGGSEPAPAEAAPVSAEIETTSSGVNESVNLLEEILADEGLVTNQRSNEQVETIGQDIGTQMGGDVEPEDYHGHYDLGLVYMDMGMYEQALPSFAQAAQGEQTRLKAMEMAGNCLRKLERHEEALVAYRKGLAMTGLPPRQYLGLLYEVASCLEALGQSADALESYERVAYLQENFLDVNERMEALRQRI